MDDMQQKLNAILTNPEMMQQLIGMAQSLGQTQPSQNPTEQPEQQAFAPNLQGLDIGLIQRIAGMAQQAGIDNNQRSLLKALSPYLNRHHITKLEKAMHAAKLAGMASAFLSSGALNLSGR